jgi:hypothetical protein
MTTAPSKALEAKVGAPEAQVAGEGAVIGWGTEEHTMSPSARTT